MRASEQSHRLPESDVSSGVGLAGLLGLAAWILFCRNYAPIADTLGLPGPHAPMSGPFASLAAMVFTAGPMVVWSLLVDKVHLRPSTGIDWTSVRPRDETLPVSSVKLIGLWATWAIIAGFYCLGRWYWDGQYQFAMQVLSLALVPMLVLSIPYVIWLDRRMIEPRDHAWHFGAMLLAREAYDPDEVKKHWRAWAIKGFFGAFMISILPGGFQQVVEADFTVLAQNPAQFAWTLIALLFVVDVQLGTVGYLVTFRPLDAHIRSGNPFLAGWVAALLCYPPFVFGFMGGEGIIAYEVYTPGWTHWFAGNPLLLGLWGAMLVFLTAIYAWATVAFGIRFSNLTYRGVLTNGPYRFTRHPAYISKNLFWWLSVLPFLVSADGSIVDVIRNTFFLGVTSAIYYWRARTEEAHLLAEDPKYRAYYDWMQQHGLITAPLARMLRKFRPRGPIIAQPAE
ncbi:methyltransferase family protein [Parerythrobacter aestuarii]|uniref:methyltransferase family protein n=1 Tax=Parerythrobacter aestuarii TaxID=3020909 RepID=UPI0024DEDD5F|nr:isoprenylcysteine carboxylmethyltransferase family protein [Parerythrobacter aestuarii]